MSDMIKDAIKCIENKDIIGMKNLLENGLDPNSMDADGKSLVILSRKHKEMRDLVFSYSVLVGTSEAFKKAFKYVKEGNVNGLKELLDNGLSVDSQDANDRSLFFNAMVENQANILNLLIEYNVNTQCSHTNPLKHACAYCTQAVIECLMEKIVFTNEELADGIDALLGSECNLPLIKLFLNANIDLKALYTDETILFRLAERVRPCWSEQEEQEVNTIADYLILNGADVDYKNKLGNKASDVALNRKSLSLGYHLRGKEKIDLVKLSKQLQEVHFPKEAYTYLENPQSKLDFSSKKYQAAQNTTLCSLKELRFAKVKIFCGTSYSEGKNVHADPNRSKNGYYSISIVDLIRKVNDYSVFGLLVWIPDLKSFGTCDTEHGTVYVFKGVDWITLVESIMFYINYQWNPVRSNVVKDIYDVCKPWNLWNFEPWN